MNNHHKVSANISFEKKQEIVRESLEKRQQANRQSLRKSSTWVRTVEDITDENVKSPETKAPGAPRKEKWYKKWFKFLLNFWKRPQIPENTNFNSDSGLYKDPTKESPIYQATEIPSSSDSLRSSQFQEIVSGLNERRESAKFERSPSLTSSQELSEEDVEDKSKGKEKVFDYESEQAALFETESDTKIEIPDEKRNEGKVSSQTNVSDSPSSNYLFFFKELVDSEKNYLKGLEALLETRQSFLRNSQKLTEEDKAIFNDFYAVVKHVREETHAIWEQVESEGEKTLDSFVEAFQKADLENAYKKAGALYPNLITILKKFPKIKSDLEGDLPKDKDLESLLSPLFQRPVHYEINFKEILKRATQDEKVQDSMTELLDKVKTVIGRMTVYELEEGVHKNLFEDIGKVYSKYLDKKNSILSGLPKNDREDFDLTLSQFFWETRSFALEVEGLSSEKSLSEAIDMSLKEKLEDLQTAFTALQQLLDRKPAFKSKLFRELGLESNEKGDAIILDNVREKLDGYQNLFKQFLEPN